MRQSRFSLALAKVFRARNCPAESHVVKLRADGTQAGLYVPEAFAIRQLREGQTQKLIKARKTLDFMGALVAFHAAVKGLQGQVVH
jgi:hypothetical protein